MRRLDLDFASRSTALRKLGVIGFVFGFFLLLYFAYAYFTLIGELDNWEVQWRQAQTASQVSQTAMAPKEWERMQTEFQAANRVIKRLNFPWGSLFYEIESSVDEDITLLRIEPDVEKKEVRITGEAKDLATMLEYEKRLQSMPVFFLPYITSHEIQQQDIQKPVRFVVLAQWLASVKP